MKQGNKHDFLLIGGGIFGLSTAVELAERKLDVGLINPNAIPHPLAASTDISKIVRLEYGSDEQYFRMAEASIASWHRWNKLFHQEVYHETGLMMLCQEEVLGEYQQFEGSSYRMLKNDEYEAEILNQAHLAIRMPALNHTFFPHAHFGFKAGWVDASQAIQGLATYARSLGVKIYEGQTAHRLVIEKKRLKAIETKEGNSFSFGHAVLAAGAHTPQLLPELQAVMRSTGHPVFWLKPHDPSLFSSPQFHVFTADIAHTGWYGFPLHPEQGVVKIARHKQGLPLHPDQDDRYVTAAEVAEMRDFVSHAFPALADAPLVYTRRCLYADTLDGHFWIDRHPEIEGLSVSTGGSGHAMKMGPVLGKITADVILNQKNIWADRFRWRNFNSQTQQQEEARCLD